MHEIFGVHEHIRDVCRRVAKLGMLAVAPDLFVRQGDVSKIADFKEISSKVVSKVPDAQVMSDLDATVAWAKTSGGGDAARVAITGFCWGGRITWLYAAHSAASGGLKAGVAWYGRLVGDKDALHPRQPIDVAGALKAPVLGLYGGQDQGIPVASVEEMRKALAAGGAAAKRSEIARLPGLRPRVLRRLPPQLPPGRRRRRLEPPGRVAEGQRRDAMIDSPARRSLPLAPRAERGLRHLPLAPEARDVDRRYRPIYAVWEVTLKCDLACRHCGSRAGRTRPDELSTEECLDLVRQMAALGVLEVTVIGGEAYLRDDWLEIVARHPRRRDAVHDDHRRPRHDAGARPRRAATPAAERQRVDRRHRGDARSHCAAWPASYRAALDAAANLRAAGVARLGQHADQQAVDGGAARRPRDGHRASAGTPGRSSSPSRWGAPPTRPRCCCSP